MVSVSSSQNIYILHRFRHQSKDQGPWNVGRVCKDKSLISDKNATPFNQLYLCLKVKLTPQL